MSLRERLREDVKEATRECISSFAENGTKEVPKGDFLSLKDSPLGIIQPDRIDKPSLAIKDPSKHSNTHFREIAQEIVDALEVDHVPDVAIDKDGMMSPGPSDTEREYEEELVKFAGMVMDYVGDFEFDDEAFQVAYDDNFYPQLTDYKRVQVVIPIRNVVTDGPLELSSDFYLENQFFGPYTIEDIELSELEDVEVEGIVNFSEGLGVDATPRIAPGYDVGQKLKFEIVRRPSYESFRRYCDKEVPDKLQSEEITVTPQARLSGNIHQQLIREMVTAADRCFRLFSPQCNPEFHAGYVSIPGFLSYRNIALDIVDKHPIERNDGTVEGTLAFTDEGKRSDFESFWEKYIPVITESDEQFSKPLNRFDEMYKKNKAEDQLLDCLIALERTLLTDTSKASSYTFRMGLRSGIILDSSSHGPDWDRERFYEFFKELYGIRSDVVHNDISISSALDSAHDGILSEYNSEHRFLSETRELFAALLLTYVEYYIEEGMSVHEINKAVDRAARDVEFEP